MTVAWGSTWSVRRSTTRITDTARHLEGILPGLRVLGTAPGRVDPESAERLLAELSRLRPDLVLVGLGFPAQERLMARLAPRLEHGVLVGEGGSFDFRELGGGIRRAPRWCGASAWSGCGGSSASPGGCAGSWPSPNSSSRSIAGHGTATGPPPIERARARVARMLSTLLPAPRAC